MSRTSQADDEIKHLRTQVQQAVDSGDYQNYAAICAAAGLPSTALYRLMKRLGGVSPDTAKALRKVLAKYTTKPTKELAHGNGAEETSSALTSASKGTVETTFATTTTSAKLHLTEAVLARLVKLRQRSRNDVLCTKIDEVVARWGTEGLEVLVDAALQLR